MKADRPFPSGTGGFSCPEPLLSVYRRATLGMILQESSFREAFMRTVGTTKSRILSLRVLGALLAAALCCACGAGQTAPAPEAPSLSGEVSPELQQAEPAAGEAEDPYQPVLDAYYEALAARQAAPEQWKAENSDLLAYSILVNPFWSWDGKTDGLLDGVGFARMDLNSDGTDELLLGWSEASGESWNLDAGYFFAVYTVENGRAVPALEGWERNRYVAGRDGYLYNSGSSSAWDSVYIKYRFDPTAEGYLVPMEGLRSRLNDSQAAECLWEHLTDPEEIAAIWETEPRPELEISQEDALALGDGWMASGAGLDVTVFSQYAPAES